MAKKRTMECPHCKTRNLIFIDRANKFICIFCNHSWYGRRKVVVSVLNGIAQIEYCPTDVEVEII